MTTPERLIEIDSQREQYIQWVESKDRQLESERHPDLYKPKLQNELEQLLAMIPQR